MLGDDFLLELAGDEVVVGKLGVVAAAALGKGGQGGGEVEHLGHRHLRLDGGGRAARVHPLDAPAAGVDVAHQVAGELLRGVDFDVEDGLEQRGLGLLHAFLEGERAGDLEGDVARVHVVVLPVVEDGAEVHHRVAGQVPALGRGHDALLHRRDEVPGDGAAENVVHELEPRPARQRLHLHPGDAELPAPARLFLVLAFGLGPGADGFAVGNFRRL